MPESEQRLSVLFQLVEFSAIYGSMSLFWIFFIWFAEITLETIDSKRIQGDRSFLRSRFFDLSSHFQVIQQPYCTIQTIDALYPQ